MTLYINLLGEKYNEILKPENQNDKLYPYLPIDPEQFKNFKKIYIILI